ncbi:MerR family transcriptional regulator [Bacillus horti]|uniref:DNA-binding transcriptional MerR regulator n=1 Tax=Caldalkalibacillus horti TaxID=77523 RepID=A0ABT9W2M6_9BACI|nr:MerR family transcriptional regulator [Bacillus horti]MDQ0167498.1 DNA-binding transcriptional MerR regulator [Bacillus horti]
MELTVGNFARYVKTTLRTLRHYEQIGLLVPKMKNRLNQKVYSRDELKKFYNIQLLKSLNMPLHEIKQRLENPKYSFKDMLEVQEAVLLDKKEKINMSLEMINRIKNLVIETGHLKTDDLMLLMNSIRLEEDQRVILNQYFSSNTVDTIMPKGKSQQKELDRLNMRLLSFVQSAIQNGLSPESDQVQRELKELLKKLPLPIDELSNTNNNFDEQLEIFQALLPVDMVEFVKEAMQALYKKHKEE